MKILLINNFHYRKGGSEAVYFNTAELLRKHGHKVVFFSYKDEKNVPSEQEWAFLEKGSKLKQLRNYFYNPEAASRLEDLILKEKPDVAHVHLFWGGISPSIFSVLEKHQIPLVHTVHDYRMVCPAYTFKNSKGEICEKCGDGHFMNCLKGRCSKGSLIQSALMTIEMYYRNASHHPADHISKFIFVSEFAKNKHLEYDKKFKPSQCEVLYNFRSDDVVATCQDNIDTYNSYYLYYGRLSYEKGIPTLLKVFARHPELKLKVVGTGPLEQELKEQYKQDTIEFLGYKSGKELFDIVSNAKFVCVPSEWYENNPMTVIEAYSLGTPVIGASIGGITEIVKDGETGYLFESGDIESLDRVIKNSTTLSSDEYKGMKHKALSFADNNFDAEVHYQRLIDIYQQIL